MVNLPDLRNFDLAGKRVLVRVDFDVPLVEQESKRVEEQEWVVGDGTRIENALPTIKYLLSVGAKIVLLSHLGRPEGEIVQELSLRPVAESLATILERRNTVKREDGWQIGEEIFLRENLRFNPGEEANSLEFSRQLAPLGDFYINDAFAVSHREHASIVSLPKLLPHAAGLSLLREVEVLSGVLENHKRPIVVILGGTKEDKLEIIPGLSRFADYILMGGKLSKLMVNGKWLMVDKKKIVTGELNKEGKDITLETVEKFSELIGKAGTVIWAGPMGQYEEGDMGHGTWDMGTREIGKRVVESGAFTVIGGGDTEAALTKFGLVEKIDFVSSGGGAMLEFLANGDLPGLKALGEG